MSTRVETPGNPIPPLFIPPPHWGRGSSSWGVGVTDLPPWSPLKHYAHKPRPDIGKAKPAAVTQTAGSRSCVKEILC